MFKLFLKYCDRQTDGWTDNIKVLVHVKPSIQKITRKISRYVFLNTKSIT